MWSEKRAKKGGLFFYDGKNRKLGRENLFCLSPDFSKNVVNAVNLEVKFINFHHSLQGLKLPYLHLIFEEDVNFDLDVIQNLHHILHSVKMNFCEEEY